MKRGILAFLLFIVLFSCTLASAASPVLFFSDLESGPKTGWEQSTTKGAAVTIWGNNFGTVRGSSYVTVDGVQLTQDSDYAEWGVTAGNARGMERITFWLNSNMPTGAGTITVTVNGVTSNALPFYVRTSGNIYFVSTSGSNNNPGTFSSPWRTWQYAEDSLSPGDIVYGRGGNYTSPQDLGDLNRGLYIEADGTVNNPIAFIAYPGEKPVIYPSGVTGAIVQLDKVFYCIISGLHCYNPNGDTEAISIATWWQNGGTNNNGNLRIIGNVAERNFKASEDFWDGAFSISNSHDVYIAGNQISDVGNTRHEHGLYLNEEMLNVIVEYNEIYDVHNGYGIEIYNDPLDPYTNCIIRNNLVYKTGRAGIQISCPGTYKVYNNIVWDCGQISSAGINLRRSTSSTSYEIYNNILYDNGQNELSDGEDYPQDEPYGHIWKDDATLSSLIFRNNIIYSLNSAEPYWKREYTGGSQTFSNNFYYGNGGKPSFDNSASTLNVNPQFYSPISDFHLQATSPAINFGYDASSVVTGDYDGNPRPQDEGFDIGAYEYLSSEPIQYHSADTNQNGKIEMRELIAFIGLWKQGSANVNDVMSALDRWFRGS